MKKKNPLLHTLLFYVLKTSLLHRSRQQISNSTTYHLSYVLFFKNWGWGVRRYSFKNKKKYFLKHLLYEENPFYSEPLPLPYSVL